MIRHFAFGMFLVALLFSIPAYGQKNCVKGKPCGNTCIARNKTCHIGSSSTRSSSSSSTSTRTNSSTSIGSSGVDISKRALEIPIPEGAQYVASSDGRLYFYVGCAAWRTTLSTDVVWYESADKAEAAGLFASGQDGCGRQSDDDSNITPHGLFETRQMCFVNRIIDGDTLECGDGRVIRLLLIDAPEAGQGVFGEFATMALEAVAPVGMRLRVFQDVERHDRYGRTLAHLVRPDGMYVNQELLRRGMAVVSVYPPNVALVDEYRVTVNEAQARNAGLWALNGFECLPVEFRNGTCN